MNCKVIKYVDVDKNKDGFWYVSKTIKTGIEIVLDDPKSPEALKSVLKVLKSEGVIESSDARKIGVVPGQDVIEIFEKKSGMPLARLEKH